MNLNGAEKMARSCPDCDMHDNLQKKIDDKICVGKFMRSITIGVTVSLALASWILALQTNVNNMKIEVIEKVAKIEKAVVSVAADVQGMRQTQEVILSRFTGR